MLRKISGAVAFVGLCALSAFFLSCGNSSSRPQGLLYVVSDASSNVTSYSINLNNGNLSLINYNASTCTNPSGCGLASGLILDPNRSTAFVLNAGLAGASPPVPPTIYGYTVNGDGSLSNPTTAATLPTGDTSVAMTANAAGTLYFVIDIGSNPAPTDCLGTGNNGPDCPSILVFSASPGSTSMTLTGNNCTVNSTSGPCPFRLSRIPSALSVITFTPPAPNNTTETLLFVTSVHDLTSAHNDNELSVYSVDSSGNLTEQPNSPYTTPPVPRVVMAVNTNAPPQTTGGVFVYAGTQGSVSGAISGFQVCTEQGQNGCTLPVGSNQLVSVGTPNAAGDDPVAMLVDPTNSFLYVTSQISNQVLAYGITTDTGTLTPLTPASQPTGAQPVALALHPNYNNSAEFLYVSNYSANSVTGFTVGVTTGTLTSPTTTLFQEGQPDGMAAK